ncbi:Cell cycle regulated microtubule associated protein [Forsythia ovata]|uniref:Cell cycle regulated microtubule associated protein n=1 Tax=Forsythia ovata TaxID=205694 RepID=A0ABD1WPX7_9LAMI
MEYSFMDNEIDFDYEFDAARFFDFSRAESLAETSQAELWFHSAGSYPPSPFVARLVQREDISLENINTSPKPKDVEIMKLSDSDSGIEAHQEISAVDVNCREYEGLDGQTSTNLQVSSVQMSRNLSKKLPSGLNFYNHTMNDTSKTKTNLSVKPSFPRTSTLMKPTASQLAKQNRPPQDGDFRSKKSLIEKTEKGTGNPFGIENQAAKRQKLDGGHLRKVVGVVQKTSFVHKVPKRDATVDGNMMQAKPRITIPREPDLETAHRAERIRPNASKEGGNVTSTVRRFKALPLNRKILEAPSLLLPKRSTPQLPEFQEFRLKTSERAMQHSSAVSISKLPCNNSDKALHEPSANSCMESANGEWKRSNLMDGSRLEVHESLHGFKALPVNQKILSSKGDIGVFRNRKKETTVPMEFNFETEKRVQHNPPIELLNKLSLTSDQPIAGSQTKLPLPTCLPVKGSKENRCGSFQQEYEIKQVVKQKLLSVFGGKQIQHSTDGRKEVGPASGINRGTGIR